MKRDHKQTSQQFVYLSVVVGLLSAGCSSFDYREAGDGRRVAVLKNPGESLPSFGKDWSAFVAAAGKTKGQTEIQIQGQKAETVRNLYETMDQANAQFRNFLVASYACYINAEFEHDPAARTAARQAWIESLSEAHRGILGYRQLSAAHAAEIARTEESIEQLVRQISYLEFETPQREELRQTLTGHCRTLESMERNLLEDERSDVLVLAKGILAFMNRKYDDAIRILPPLRDQSPIKYYVLAAAYDRTHRTNECRAAVSTLCDLAQWMKNSRLEAMGLLGQGIVAVYYDNNEEKALCRFGAAAKKDQTYWPAHYNLAAVYGRNKDGCEQSIDSLVTFMELSGFSAEQVVREMEGDPDVKNRGAFKALIEKYTKGVGAPDKSQEWMEPLAKELTAKSKESGH